MRSTLKIRGERSGGRKEGGKTLLGEAGVKGGTSISLHLG